MSIPEDDPIAATRCPWCTRTEDVHPATDHERDRTGMAWWAECCKRLFHGTATEYQRIRVAVTAAAAERMASSPKTQEDA